MKKFLLTLCLLSLIVIGGCGKTTVSNSMLGGHLSDNPDKFSLFIINDKKSQVDWNAWEQKNKIANVGVIEEENTLKYKSLKKAQKDYKTLNIDKLPYYVVFNSYKMVYQTSSEQNLLKYLHENNPKD